MRYRKKPVIIEAWKYHEDAGNARQLARRPEITLLPEGGLQVTTLEGVHIGTPGDYLIKGVKGEYYFCKPDIFEETYEPVEARKEKRDE